MTKHGKPTVMLSTCFCRLSGTREVLFRSAVGLFTLEFLQKMTTKKQKKLSGLPDALAFPPRTVHQSYARKGAAATAAATARRKRLAQLNKG